MPSKDEVKGTDLRFLEAIAHVVQAKITLRVSQTGWWWSEANPGDSKVVVQSSGTTSMSQSGRHEREVFNLGGVNVLYQTELREKDFPEQNELHEVIATTGIETSWIQFGFMLPLIHGWCGLPEPLDLSHPATEKLLEAFATSVVEHESITTYRDAISDIDLGGEPLVLEDGIVLRPITEDELYELSRERHPSLGHTIQFSPSDNWPILEIQIKHPTEDSPKIFGPIHDNREALIADLALANTARYTLLPLGHVTNFGVNTGGNVISGSQLPREFGHPFPGFSSTMSPETRKKISDLWPRVKKIMIPGSDYLALPLRRLVDALGRA